MQYLLSARGGHIVPLTVVSIQTPVEHHYQHNGVASYLSN